MDDKSIWSKSKKREKRRFGTSINDNSTPSSILIINFILRVVPSRLIRPWEGGEWIYQAVGEGEGVPIASSCTGV